MTSSPKTAHGLFGVRRAWCSSTPSQLMSVAPATDAGMSICSRIALPGFVPTSTVHRVLDRQESPYRRGNRYDQLPIPMAIEHCIFVDAGAVQLVVESRNLTNEIIEGAFDGNVRADVPFDDFGATLHVCGTADGLEHLRFDCFENEPHYHYVDHRLPDMLRHCGVADLADEVVRHPDKPNAAIAEVRDLMQQARTRWEGS